MKNIISLKSISILCFLFCFSINVIGQEIWKLKEDNTFHLNNNSLLRKLKLVSKEGNSSVVINFPDHNGKLTPFKVVDNSVLPEKLALKYPSVHAYKGNSTEYPDLSITFTCTPRGISGNLIKGAKIWSFEHLEQSSSYKVVNNNNIVPPRGICTTKSDETSNIQLKTNNSAKTLVGDNTLRVLRTAIIATGEYSNFFTNGSGTEEQQKATVLGAIVATLNNINLVFERDLGIRFELIENNDDLIFLDSNSDPFTVDSLDPSFSFHALTVGSQQINNIIGIDNYDIGHTFGAGFAGLAQVGALCGFRKGEGASALQTPVGTIFDFTLVAHEFGHQLGATHTQNYICERVSATSVEPGSGSTIMGYAGIFCVSPEYEVQPQSDEYFHLVSIDQIRSHVQSVSCGIETSAVTNNNPVIEQLPNYTIPASTPFVLEATATDADGDALTYCWEQLDTEQAEVIPPVSTEVFGPLFRSLTPTTNPERVFETNTTWEVIPTVSRSMDFGVTVRDGNPGGIASTSLSLDVVDTGEIFRVILPPENFNLAQDSNFSVEWVVAGTDANGINTENVKIELSVDGGETYEYVLAESTPNDGAEAVDFPILESTNVSTAKIKITPTDNIYFATSQGTFRLSEPQENNIEAIRYPFSDILTLRVNKKQTPEYEFYLYDLHGREIQSAIFDTDFEQVDVSALTTGIYIIRIILGANIFTQKIVIQ